MAYITDVVPILYHQEEINISTNVPNFDVNKWIGAVDQSNASVDTLRKGDH